MACMGMQVRSESVCGALVQVVVFSNQLLELRLYVEEVGKFVFDDRDPHLFRRFRKRTHWAGVVAVSLLCVGKYGGRSSYLEEQHTSAFAVNAAGCPDDSVHISARRVGRVGLDDKADHGDVESTSGNISAEEDAGFCIVELKT